jgi:hypothetical protein
MAYLASTYLASNSILRGNSPKYTTVKLSLSKIFVLFSWKKCGCGRTANVVRWITVSFLTPRFLVVVLAGVMFAFGIAQLRSMSVDAIAQQSLTSVNEFEDFDSKNFDRSTHIDNKWFPLNPGTQFLYKGFTIEHGKRVSHRVVFTVTDLTKVINGVRAVVAHDSDYSGGKLVEAEIVFFAQDNDGTVWQLGEYPEEYENGKIAGAPAWIHGVQDARAGISMKAEPRIGAPGYSQGWAPAVSFMDRGVVDQVVQKLCVPLDCYEDVLVIDETSKQEPGAHQFKYYARDVGIIRVGWKGAGEKTKETLDLVKVEQLGPQALAEARAAALKLETRAYKISKKVYVHTPPAEHTPGAKGQ